MSLARAQVLDAAVGAFFEDPHWSEDPIESVDRAVDVVLRAVMGEVRDPEGFVSRFAVTDGEQQTA